jgi:signal transduction histidine kinase
MAWDPTYSPAIWPSLVTMLLLLTLAAYSWRRRSVPGALAFAISCLLAVPMTVGMFMTDHATQVEDRLFWCRFEYACILPCISAITCFILEYAWPGRWVTRRNLALLAIVPLLSEAGIWWGGFLQAASLDATLLDAVAIAGSSGMIFLIYVVALSLINLIAFAWLFARSPQHRWPVALMAIAQIIVRGLFLIDYSRLDALVLSIPLFVFPYLFYASALFSFRIFDPVAMGRQTAIEQLHAGMLILDPQDRVASLNPSAERILRVPAASARGRWVKDLLPAYPDQLPPGPAGAEIEFSLGAGQALCYYTLSISPIKDFRGLDAGRLLLLRDVTVQKQAHAQSLEQQRALAMLQEREQLARELHDSLGQVFAFISLQGQAAHRLLRRDDPAAAEEYIARLVEIAREADVDIRESILGLRAPLPVQGLFPALRRYLAQYEKNCGIRVELEQGADFSEDAFEPLVEVQLLRILQEALTNIRKHASAGCVQIAFAREDGGARITVSDDGLGFDTSERHAGTGEHMGLRMMRERAEEVRGCIQLVSRPGQGTLLMVYMPVKGTSHG